MTVPEVAAQRLLAACLLGTALGLWYGFLRPLRPKYTALCDGAFAAALLLAWLKLMFGVCRGDLRVGALVAMMLSAVVSDRTVGCLFRPVFRVFWGFVAGMKEMLGIPLKKIYKIAKILLSYWKN